MIDEPTIDRRGLSPTLAEVDNILSRSSRNSYWAEVNLH